MIGIRAIAGYLPTGRLDNLERKERFAVSEDFVLGKIGMRELSVKAADQDTSDLCREAFAALQEKEPVNLQDVDCLVVCTQNPDGHGLPHTSAIVHGKLGLSPECAAFDISLGCSGYGYSLSVMRAFMEANDLRCGLLFTADPYSKVINKEDKNTALLFGDAATVTLLGDSPRWELGKFVFGTKGSEGGALCVREDRLYMNGRAVFSFSATTVPESIKRALEKNGLEPDDVDQFILHQGSRYIVNTIRKALKLPEDKVPFAAQGYGNTVSSSIPLILEHAEADTVLISGFGVGLSWSSGVLFRKSATSDE